MGQKKREILDREMIDREIEDHKIKSSDHGSGVRGKILCGVIAAALFAALFAVTFRPREGRLDRQPVDIVIFGDSIFGEIRDEQAVPAQLQQILGQSIYNGAFGGTCAARVDSERRLDYTRDLFCLAELAKSVESGDFGVQQSVNMRESNTEYFGEVIDGLDAIDFSGVGTFLIQQGVNDYHAGVPIDNPEEPYDERTFMGAVRSAVRSLRKVNPQARIVLITPVYTWYIVTGKTCEETDGGGGVLEDYVNADLRLAEELDIEVIDVYHGLYSHEKWEDWQFYSRDGLHPNENGRKLLTERIAEGLLRQTANIPRDK